jgi:hypothetical protein
MSRGRIIDVYADDAPASEPQHVIAWRERFRAAFAAGVMQPPRPRLGPEPDDDVMRAWRDKVREIKARELERRRERWRRRRQSYERCGTGAGW